MNKDRVVIEEGGMRYVMEHNSSLGCNGCELKCTDSEICKMCVQGAITALKCISATKIEPEPKMYFAWNLEEARWLEDSFVEAHTGDAGGDWVCGKLIDFDEGGAAFQIEGFGWRRIIRETRIIKLTRAELNEKYGVPDNVVIVEGD